MKKRLDIEVDDFSELQKEIEKSKNKIERTVNFTRFYVSARFNIDEDDFKKYCVDGKNDGGIDFCFSEGNTYYIIQSKYHEKSQRESATAISDELYKFEKTILGKNMNKYAVEFINDLKRHINEPKAYLEILWLTTNEVQEKTKIETQEDLSKIADRNSWKINTDINFIDRFALESVIYDIKHGYVPHTGKKELTIERDEYMKLSKDNNNIESIVCNIEAMEILKWFDSLDHVKKYLQKNVRESIGDKSPINKALRKSFKEEPRLFWYKHNGIILFVDWLEINNNIITVRNPQIVNGGQTITQLFKAYDENRHLNNPAKILTRIYRLPYEDSETYKRSIDIIAALNSQNKIKASDLHSTDPCQVMIEKRIEELGERFSYFRKRSEQESKKSSWYHISMVNLAMYYHVCEYKKPDEGVRGNIESYFEEDKKYNESFPEKNIKRPLSNNLEHIIFKYIECWYLYFVVKRYLPDELKKKQNELFDYLLWYILSDTYQQQQMWKERCFSDSWREWITFIEGSEYTTAVLKYMKVQYPKYCKMIPKLEHDPKKYLKSSEARKKFLKISGKHLRLKFKNELNRGLNIYCTKRGY